MNELLSRVLEELRYAWRFRWYAALIAWAICLVGWVLVYSLPNVYNAKASIRLDTTSVITPLIKDLTVSPSPEWKVNLLIHTVLSKPNLRKIARRTGMAVQATTPAAEQALITRLGHQIDIDNQRSRINLYSISYSNNDPTRARDVVQEVINVMTSMALGDGVKESKQAIEFLSRKVADYRAKLYETEKKLTEFKKVHPTLVTRRGGYIARLQTIRAVLAQTQTKLKTLVNTRKSLQDRLDTLAGNSVAVPVSQSSKVQSLDGQIRRYENELSQLLTQYTPQYPDVVRHNEIIERLKSKRADLVENLRAHPEYVPGTSTAKYGRLEQRLRELKVEIETLKSSIADKTLQVKVLSSNSGEATEASAQFADLSRDYESTKQQYEELLSRLNAARLSRDVDTFSDPIEFRIVNPPEVPSTASGPPRLLFMLVVLCAGLGGGAVFAFFLAQIRPVFMTRRRLTDVTGLPVLGSVHMAWNVRQRLQRRTDLLLYALVIGGLMVGFVAAVMFMPIGVRVVPAVLGRQWL